MVSPGKRWLEDLLWVALVVSLTLWATFTYGQISVPQVSPLYTLIEVEAVPPTVGNETKVYYEWTYDHSQLSVYKKQGNQRLILTATPGKHVLMLRVVCIDYAKKKYTYQTHESVFEVAQIPPTPIPPPTPVPLPDTNLCDLVTPDVATKLAAIYKSQAGVIERGTGTHTAVFRLASARQLEQEGLTGHKATAAINARVDKAIGPDNAELTDNLRHKLVACLRGLEADLRCSPTPTPVPTPDDRWGLSTAVGAALRDMPPLAKGDGRAVATVGLYRQAADGLANAEFVSMNQAAKWLQTERKKLWGDHAGSWAAFEKPVSDIWNDAWPMLKGDVIEFYRAVANGIEATL